jgi:AbrB family looped-hinge helix DNA binding protein
MRSKVTMSDRGVITIPAALRESYGLKPNDELILEDTDAGILLRPSVSVPIEVYTEARIAEFAADETAIGRYLPGKRTRARRPRAK